PPPPPPPRGAPPPVPTGPTTPGATAGAPAMKLKLRRIFPSLACRAGKPQHQGIVDRFHPARIAGSALQPYERRVPRLRHAADERDNGVPRCRTAHSYDRNGGRGPPR